MSVELYPDHKAILHFHDSLKVYEIDFLDYLTKFLSRDEYAKRHFEIYVKPTLGHSAFDFMVLEPNRALYVIQTPENMEQYQFGLEAMDYFMKERLYTLSPALLRRIQQTVDEKKEEKKVHLIKRLFYIYEENLLEDISNEDEMTIERITPDDFHNSSSVLEKAFDLSEEQVIQLSETETEEIQRTLNPNTNFNNYISTSLPKDYEEYARSQSQSKQKYKGPTGSGKTLLLVNRVIHCANRLKEDGRILVVSGKLSKVNDLKDLITAEDGRSLQELGIDVSSFQELATPEEKYHALFIDDAHELKNEWMEHLLEHYLIDMTEEKEYEYVVMANEDDLPGVPRIFGPFRSLKHDLGRINKMLTDKIGRASCRARVWIEVSM